MTDKKIKPPVLAEWILLCFSDPSEKNSIIGDFNEMYFEFACEKGFLIAKIWYWWHLIISLPSFFRGITYGSFSMFKNYLKIAFRNLVKHKVYSFINIAGLAVGMACCIIVLLWIQNELSYDRFHEKTDSIHRVIFEKHRPERISHEARGANATGPALKNEYPEIVNFTRFRGGVRWLVKYKDKEFENDILSVADPSFFEIFTFPFIKGDPKTALSDPRSVVITEVMAEKYFGDEDPMGKTLKIDVDDFRISGVIEKIPFNSHIQFDYVFPIVNMEESWVDPLDSWTRDFRFHTYVQLNDNCDWKDVSLKISDSNIVRKNHPESTTEKIYLQPLKDIHLYSNFRMDVSGKGSIKTVYMFSIIALSILFIACINFMNLSTARSSTRLKEVGMRKVVGAGKNDVMKQFFGESVFLSLISLFFAIILVYIFLPVFNELSNKQLVLNLTGNPQVLFSLILVAVLTGLVSGSYPALFLSSFQPVRVLKGMISTKAASRSIFRKILVVFQFTVTIAMIIGIIIINRQLTYIDNKDIGFNKKNMITFWAAGNFGSNYKAIRTELLQHPGIESLTRGFSPTGWFGLNSNRRPIDWEGKDPEKNVLMLRWGADYDLLETYKMEMAEGRYFSREFPTDTSNYIINQAAVKEMGIDSPVGKWFSYNGRRGRIIGVLKNFHQVSLRSEVLPLLLRVNENNHVVAARINPENVAGTVRHIESVWNKYVKDYPFSYEFLDEKISNFYKNERKTNTIIKYSTFLTIFLSCLGLFGMSAFMVERRTKEIGIRKVLGASVSNIVIYLTREFTKWVVLGNVIAWPLAWYVMNRWLENYKYHIDLGIFIFVTAGIIALMIALLTVSFQAVKAARAKPVDTLKYE